MFGQPIPAFNIKGKDKVKTLIGGILSYIIISVTLGYAINLIPDLILKTNPIINESKIQDYFGKQKDGVDLKEIN